MYIIGDSTCASSVKMWKDVVHILKSRDQIGPTFRLRCPRHENAKLIVSKPEDFETVAPEGGCSEICGKRLDCGHACEFLCHAESRHLVAGCRKPCERGRPTCGHGCPKRCSDPCGDCTVIVKDVRLPCGHVLPEAPCHLAQDLAKAQLKCHVRAKRTLQRCSHEVEMSCCESPEAFKCQEICGGLIGCRHQICVNPCYKCTPDHHAPCLKVCDKDFSTCSHRCRRQCHQDDCGLCKQPCELRCVHSRCTGKCGEHCVPCAEPCTWKCEHLGQCNMPCGAPCDRLPCNERCSQLLDCGHQCPSVCGEICPPKEFCQECCSSELRETVVDCIGFDPYGSVDVTDDPILVLPCKHIYTVQTLDGAFEINSVYIRDADTGNFIGCIPNGSMASQRPQCPQCRSPVSLIQRYNRVVKRSVLDLLLRNFISRSQLRYLELATLFEKYKSELDGSRDECIGRLRPLRHHMQRRPTSNKNAVVISDRLKLSDRLKTEIRKYMKEVDESRQPHMRVYAMSIAALSRVKGTTQDLLTESESWPLDVPSPDIKHRLLANILDLRLEVSRRADVIQFLKQLSSLRGCEDEAIPLYVKMMKECELLRSEAGKIKSECDQRNYHCLAVESILLQVDITALSARAAEIVDKSKIEKFRETGLQLLDACEVYLRTYQSCEIYRTAAERAREMLRVLGPFYDSVSQEERNAVYEAMSGNFGNAVRWYYCRNRHPVCFKNGPAYVLIISSLSVNAVVQWKRHAVPNAENLSGEEVIILLQGWWKLSIFVR